VRNTWVRAVAIAVPMAVLPAVFSWGLAGGIAAGCDWNTRGCEVPDGAGKYFAAVAGSFLGLVAFVSTPLMKGLSDKGLDYRSMVLGFSAGTAAGAVVSLTMGTSIGHWILSACLAAVGVLVLWPARAELSGRARTRKRAR
jgi:hypothetical protein